MTSTLLKHCAYVVTLDGDGTVLRDVDVTLSDGKILAIGDQAASQLESFDQQLDASNKLLMPGLVNLHTHLAMTLTRGAAEDVDLSGFLQRVWAVEGNLMDAETVALGTKLGAWEALASGTTMACDMYFHHEAGRRAAGEAGLRLANGPTVMGDAAPDRLSFEDRLEQIVSWPETLDDIPGPQAPLLLSPHSPYLVNPDRLAEIRQAAIGWPSLAIHIHMSETTAENADVMNRFGRTPTKILHDVGYLDGTAPVVFAHGVHLSDEDLAMIAGKPVTVSHNPASNMKLSSGGLDWPRLRAAGIKLGIGTDGCSSSNDLDMWTAIRLAGLLARLVTGRPDAVSSVEILRAATSGGAAALGWGDRVGSVEPGKDADLVLLDLDAPHLTPILDVHALLVYAAGRGDVSDVFVGGEHVIADGRAVQIDEAELLEQTRERGLAAAAVLAHLQG